jgi:L,D-transpeptidase catalytic domain
MARKRLALALALSLTLVLAVAGVLTTGGRRRAAVGHSGAAAGAASAKALASAAAELPHPEHPAFLIGKPVPLRKGEARSRFAPVTRRVEARAGPSRSARAVAELGLLTDAATTNVVLVLGEHTGADDQWVRIRLPVLPNNLTAWVPREALGGYHFVHTRLLVDRERFQATLYYDGHPIFRAPVGVGQSESPTPAGRFYIREKLMGFGDPFYGPVAFGTSARSEVLTDWPGGGFVGIHGTNEPQLIPGRISHGCIRLRNADILRLSRLMPVGTPLTIR